jgi:hypothetical protein
MTQSRQNSRSGKLRDVTLIFGGGAIFYVVMATCARPTAISNVRDASPTDSPVSADTQSDTSYDTMMSPDGRDSSGEFDAQNLLDLAGEVFRDAMNPVPDANAQSMPTTVTTTCNIVSNGLLYAEGAFPGKTVDELAGVYVLIEYPGGVDPGGTYTHRSIHTGLSLKHGGVAFQCGQSATGIGSVKFILP